MPQSEYQKQFYKKKNDELRRLRILYYKDNPKYCQECKEIIPINEETQGQYYCRKFCSDSCRQSDHRRTDKYEARKDTLRKQCNTSYHKNKKLYEKHIDECKKCSKKFIKETNAHIYCSERCRINVYRNKKYKNDIQYRLSQTLRSAIKQRIRKNYGSQTHKVLKLDALFGCTMSDLILHLESKFQHGMSWENYGYYGWHVDHIKPCSLFNLTDIEQQKECNHFTNLQPLWAKDNMRKSDSYDHGDSNKWHQPIETVAKQ